MYTLFRLSQYRKIPLANSKGSPYVSTPEPGVVISCVLTHYINGILIHDLSLASLLE